MQWVHLGIGAFVDFHLLERGNCIQNTAFQMSLVSFRGKYSKVVTQTSSVGRIRILIHVKIVSPQVANLNSLHRSLRFFLRLSGRWTQVVLLVHRRKLRLHTTNSTFAKSAENFFLYHARIFGYVQQQLLIQSKGREQGWLIWEVAVVWVW